MNSTSDKPRSLWQSESIVTPADLEIGNFVVRLDIPWIDTPFPLQGVRIDSEETRDWFVQHCQWVVIDHEREAAQDDSERAARSLRWADDEKEDARGAESSPVDALKGSRLNPEVVEAANEGYRLLDTHARQLIRRFADRGSVQVKAAERVVAELSESLENNLAAMVWLTRLKERDDYTIRHSINSAILAMGLAHAMQWPRREIEQAGLAALLHDVGNVRVESHLLNKPGRLNAEEFRHIKSHTRHGYELLSAQDDVDEIIARAALEHHERPDGRGYPDGKSAGDTNTVSSLISVVDVYDAVTSERVYRPARSHHDALGILWRGRDRKFDRELVETFIQFMGWVAPGTLVRLSSDELAVVEETNIVHGFYPVVRVLVPDGDSYRAGERLDLASLGGERESEERLRIVDVLPDGAIKLDMRALLQAATH